MYPKGLLTKFKINYSFTLLFSVPVILSFPTKLWSESKALPLLWFLLIILLHLWGIVWTIFCCLKSKELSKFNVYASTFSNFRTLVPWSNWLTKFKVFFKKRLNIDWIILVYFRVFDRWKIKRNWQTYGPLDRDMCEIYWKIVSKFLVKTEIWLKFGVFT